MQSYFTCLFVLMVYHCQYSYNSANCFVNVNWGALCKFCQILVQKFSWARKTGRFMKAWINILVASCYWFAFALLCICFIHFPVPSFFFLNPFWSDYIELNYFTEQIMFINLSYWLSRTHCFKNPVCCMAPVQFRKTIRWFILMDDLFVMKKKTKSNFNYCFN